MTAQNIYDDEEFLAGYETLDRQIRGLDGAAEWQVLRTLLPDITGGRVVDLGCGFGWFTRWADEQGATAVLGIDVSAKMLDRARSETPAGSVEYRRADLDQLELEPNSCEVVFSSLTLHYVLDLDRLLAVIARALTPGGSLVFSVEHPIFSAPTSQAFEPSDGGDLIWPLDNYLVEGARVRNWFVDGVVKQHRTVETHVNAVLGAGLVLERMVEWGPSAEQIETNPGWAEDRHRPWFLLLAASKPSG